MTIRAVTALASSSLSAFAGRAVGSALLAGAILGGASGCSVGSANAVLSDDPPTVGTPYTPNSSPSGASDAGADSTAAASSRQGSPLCNAARFAGSCYPDDLATVKGCGPQPDGGPFESTTALACHVTVLDAGTPEAGAFVEPLCSVAGPGTEGAVCTRGTNCAATDECVGTGMCRRYCCEGDSVCMPNEFCDIQPLAETPDVVVPVCMPIHPCGLLDEASDAGACPAADTCAVVREDTGATGCVQVGTARANESCESEHCARDLVCSGTWNRRECYSLCHTANPVECSSGQACMTTLTLFSDPAIGVCQ